MTTFGDITSQIAGANARAAGADWEKRLDITHSTYREDGIADIWKLPEPTNAIPRGWTTAKAKRGICRVFSAKQRADYVGVLGPQTKQQGRAVLMEAKSNAAHQNKLKICKPGDRHGLRSHQLEHLARSFHEFGALSLLVWKNGDERLVFLPEVLLRAHQQQATHLLATDAMKFEQRHARRGLWIEEYLQEAVFPDPPQDA